MDKTEITKIVERDILKFFRAKTLLSNNKKIVELCVESTLKAINYKPCSEQLKDEQTISFKELMEVKEMIETYSQPLIDSLKKDKYRFSFTKKGWVLTNL